MADSSIGKRVKKMKEENVATDLMTMVLLATSHTSLKFSSGCQERHHRRVSKPQPKIYPTAID